LVNTAAAFLGDPAYGRAVALREEGCADAEVIDLTEEAAEK
jgi:hypothetical protein